METGLFFLAVLTVVVLGVWFAYSQHERGSKLQYLVPCIAIACLVLGLYLDPKTNIGTAFIFATGFFLTYSTGGLLAPRWLRDQGSRVPTP